MERLCQSPSSPPSPTLVSNFPTKTKTSYGRRQPNKVESRSSSPSSSATSNDDIISKRKLADDSSANHQNRRRPLKKRAAARHRCISPDKSSESRAAAATIEEISTINVAASRPIPKSFSIDSLLAAKITAEPSTNPLILPQSPSSLFKAPAIPLANPSTFDFSAATATAAMLSNNIQQNAIQMPFGIAAAAAAAAAQWLRFATPGCGMPYFASALAAHQQAQQHLSAPLPWPSRFTFPATVVGGGGALDRNAQSSSANSSPAVTRQNGVSFAPATCSATAFPEINGDAISGNDDQLIDDDRESNLSENLSEEVDDHRNLMGGTGMHNLPYPEGKNCNAVSYGNNNNGCKVLRSGSPLCALVEMTAKTLEEINEDVKKTSMKRALGERSLAEAAKKKRKSRTAFTNPQVFELEKRFSAIKYLNPGDRDDLAQRLGLSNAQVITWFQNRRAKYKRDMEELQKDVSAHNNSSLFFQHMFGSAFPPPMPLGPNGCGTNKSTFDGLNNNAGVPFSMPGGNPLLLPFFAPPPSVSRPNNLLPCFPPTSTRTKPSPICSKSEAVEPNVKQEMKLLDNGSVASSPMIPNLPPHVSIAGNNTTRAPLNMTTSQQQAIFNLHSQLQGNNNGPGGLPCFRNFNPPSCN